MKYVVALLFAAGCGTDAISVTIDQGVYGQLSGDGGAASNVAVTVYKAGTAGTYASAISGDDGVYQIDLSNGDYTICTTGCTSISTPNDATVRYDWTDGPDGGTWDKI
ncbi:MAG TPA: hypothetical protein VGC41_22565 [Kofleriaceae bacterium]